MVRTERPPHNGFMDYNNIIFPSIIAHFEIIEDKNE